MQLHQKYKAGLLGVAFALTAATTLSGCGGVVGGSSSGGGTPATPGSGVVDGLSLGTLSEFGSVHVNGNRIFQTGATTAFTLNGVSTSESALRATGADGTPLGKGMVVTVSVGTDANASLTAGTAVQVSARTAVKGPVTAINPLQVMGQEILSTSDTVLADLTSVASLVPGDLVEVSGYVSNDGMVRATRIQKKSALLTWKVNGTVASKNASSFTIGMLTVLQGSVTPRDCGSGLATGKRVEVKASPDGSFSGASSLSTVTDIECRTPGLSSPSNSSSSTSLKAEVEGLVSSITSMIAPADFVVAGQRVVTTASTRFSGGTLGDLVLGIKAEAEGTLDSSSGILTAKKVRFRDPRVRFEVPVSSADIMANTDIMVFGLTVQATQQSRDDDGYLGGSLSGTRQVEVRGFRDSSGTLYATRVRDRGNADLSKVRLRGPVDASPAPSDPLLTVLGVTLDTTGASVFKDTSSNTITRADFFAAVAAGGVAVQVTNGSYNSSTGVISGGQYELED